MAAVSWQTLVPLHNDRAPVAIGDVQCGGILWIRPRKYITSRCTDLQLDPNSYNHPAIVIRVKKPGFEEPLVTIPPISIQTTSCYSCDSQK